MTRALLLAALILIAAGFAHGQDTPELTAVEARVAGLERSVALYKSRWLVAKRANDYHAAKVRELRRELRRRHGPVDYAIRLAAIHHGVSERAMRQVAFCESRLNPAAANRRSSARGLYQYLSSTWSRATRLGAAGFSRYDPVAAALATARIVKVEGWRQWECKP